MLILPVIEIKYKIGQKNNRTLFSKRWQHALVNVLMSTRLTTGDYFSKKAFPMHFCLDTYTHYTVCTIAKVGFLGRTNFPRHQFGNLVPLENILYTPDLSSEIVKLILEPKSWKFVSIYTLCSKSGCSMQQSRKSIVNTNSFVFVDCHSIAIWRSVIFATCGTWTNGFAGRARRFAKSAYL